MLDPNIIGEEHYNTARGVQAILQKYKDLQDIIAILGMDELMKRIRIPLREQERLKNSYLNHSM